MANKKKETAPEADTPNVDELEELKIQVNGQAEEIAALKGINERLNKQLAAADATKVDELEALKAQVKEQVEEIAALKGINERLNKQLAASEDAAEEGEKRTIITVGKVKYDVTGVNARYKGRKITPRVLAENPDLAETLVKIGAGYMKKVQ